VLALEEKYEKDVEFIIADVTNPEGNRVAAEYEVYSIPAVFILDGKGQILHSEVGVQPLEKLDSYISRALGGK